MSNPSLPYITSFLSSNSNEEIDFDDPPSSIRDEYVTTFWHLDKNVREKVLQNHPKSVFFCFYGGFCTYQCSGDEDVDLARINLHFEKNPLHRITRGQLLLLKELAWYRRSLRDARRSRTRISTSGVPFDLTGVNAVPMLDVSKESCSSWSRKYQKSHITRKSMSPSAVRRNNSPMSRLSSRSVSRSPNNLCSRSRSPRMSRGSKPPRSRRKSRSQERQRRSRSPRRRSWSPDRRKMLSPKRRRRSSPSEKKGRLGKDQTAFFNAYTRALSPIRSNRRPAPRPRISNKSSNRRGYSAKPGPTGTRYNSRMDSGRQVDETRPSRKEWKCKKCKQIFHIQAKYVTHVEMSNIERKCPEMELVVLEDSPPAVKSVSRPSPREDIYIEDSPQLIAPESKALADLLDSISDSDLSLPPIVPPVFLFTEPISDQSLPASPTDKSSPVSLPAVPTSASLTTKTSEPIVSSPQKLTNESQFKVKVREDGVLIFDDLLNEIKESACAKSTQSSPQMLKFAKNLFISLPDLLDIPDYTLIEKLNGSEIGEESESILAERNSIDFSEPAEGNSTLLGLVLSPSSSLPSLPSFPFVSLSSNVAEYIMKKRKLPMCLTQVESVKEPDVIKKVKSPQPVDKMELLLVKKKRKQLIKKKENGVNTKTGLNLMAVKSSDKPHAIEPNNNETSDTANHQADITSSSKKKKVRMKRRGEKRKYKDQDRFLALVRHSKFSDSTGEEAILFQRGETATFVLGEAVCDQSTPVISISPCSEPGCGQNDSHVPSSMLAEADPIPISPTPREPIPSSVISTEPNPSPTLASIPLEVSISTSSTLKEPIPSSPISEVPIQTIPFSEEPIPASPTSDMQIPTSHTPKVSIPASPTSEVPISTSPSPEVPEPSSATIEISIPTTLTPNPNADSRTTSQVLADQSPPSPRRSSVLPPTSASSDLFCFDLLLDTLTVPDQTPNPNLNLKIGKLQSVDPVHAVQYQMECQLANSPTQDQTTTSTPSPPPSTPSYSSVQHSVPVSPTTLPSSPGHSATPAPHQGEVMSLYQALGGSEDSEEEEPDQPVVIRAGVDPIDKCPNCYSRLETGSKTVNFSINLSDMSVLVDCMQCGVRVRMKGALGDKQKEFLSCGW